MNTNSLIALVVFYLVAGVGIVVIAITEGGCG